MNKDIKEYWEGEAGLYGECVMGELADKQKREGWRNILLRVFPSIKAPKVLDVGTGPGFFALLMFEMGADVTAIDITDNMIKEAKNITNKNAEHIKFFTMDSHELDFENDSFDMIVCRNVTWTLNDPKKAYREWYRALKKGGKLVIFDANFNMRYFDPKIQEIYEKNISLAIEKGMEISSHKNVAEDERLAKLLYFSDKLRPQWDLNEMIEIGFKEFYTDLDFDKDILTEKDKLFWGHAPSFMIVANK